MFDLVDVRFTDFGARDAFSRRLSVCQGANQLQTSNSNLGGTHRRGTCRSDIHHSGTRRRGTHHSSTCRNRRGSAHDRTQSHSY